MKSTFGVCMPNSGTGTLCSCHESNLFSPLRPPQNLRSFLSMSVPHPFQNYCSFIDAALVLSYSIDGNQASFREGTPSFPVNSELVWRRASIKTFVSRFGAWMCKGCEEATTTTSACLTLLMWRVLRARTAPSVSVASLAPLLETCPISIFSNANILSICGPTYYFTKNH